MQQLNKKTTEYHMRKCEYFGLCIKNGFVHRLMQWLGLSPRFEKTRCKNDYHKKDPKKKRFTNV
jgi:hypothetical protein